MSDVTNRELLEAITANSEAIKSNSDAIKAVMQQVATNTERFKRVEQKLINLPREISVRTSYQFQEHEERIARLESEVGIL